MTAKPILAAYRGGDIQYFWEGERTLYGGTWQFNWGPFHNHLETMLYYHRCKFMSGVYNYKFILSQQLKRHKIPYIG